MTAEATKGTLPVTVGEGSGKNVRLVTKRGALILVVISFTIMSLAIVKFPGASQPGKIGKSSTLTVRPNRIRVEIVHSRAFRIAGAPWNNHGVSALGEKLLVAASKGDEDAVRDLLHSGAPADWRGKVRIRPSCGSFAL